MMIELGHDQKAQLEQSVRHEIHTPNAVKLLGAAGNFEQSLLAVSSQNHEGEYARFFYGIAPGGRLGAPYLKTELHNNALKNVAERVNETLPVFHPAFPTKDGGILFGYIEAVDTLEDASKPLRREARHITTMTTLYPSVDYLQLVQDINASKQRLEPAVLQELSLLTSGMTGQQLVEYGKNPQAFVSRMQKKLR